MPVHLSDHYYDPDRNYCGLYIVSKVVLPDFSPTAEMIRIFNRRGILLLNISSHQKDFITYDFVIIDLSEKEHLKEEIEKEIKERFGTNLISMECIETGVPGFIYNINGFPLIFNFSDNLLPAAAMAINTWKMLFQGLMKRFGADGLTLLWFMGNDAGEGNGIELLKLKGTLTNVDRIKIAFARLQSFGWGRFELVECDDKANRIIIRVYDNFEESATKEIKGYQNSFLRGFLVGLISLLFNSPCRGIETSCINKGDPCCEFMIRLSQTRGSGRFSPK
ncbi:MAG: V4R domain-containing protein [Candidatus Methanomethylicaceae archaeon]